MKRRDLSDKELDEKDEAENMGCFIVHLIVCSLVLFGILAILEVRSMTLFLLKLIEAYQDLLKLLEAYSLKKF